MGDPAVISDAARYRATVREHTALRKLEAAAKRYFKILDDIEGNESLLEDPDFAEEAKGEEADQAAIAELRVQLSDTEALIRSNADALAATEAKIKADTASLKDSRAKMASLDDTIGKNTAEIEKNKNEIASLNAQISSVIASLDENTLKTIAEELAAVATDGAESPHDIAKAEKKLEATDVVKLIGDSLDAIAKDVLEEIAEKRVETV